MVTPVGRNRSGTWRREHAYPLWFYVPFLVLFGLLFAIPTFASFYFSLTRWTLFDVEFIGFQNFIQFFREPMLVSSFEHTLIYAAITCTLKVIFGLLLALLLTSRIIATGFLRSVTFFPVLVSTVGVGITFKVLLDPFYGPVNEIFRVFGVDGPGWLTDPNLALYSIALVDVWKGIGVATLIYIAGIVAIPQEYMEAAQIDGAGGWRRLISIIIPLSWPATTTVIVLALIGGLRSFELIWATTGGGPGFASDVVASVIYKQYQAGFYGLSTAGNVILFVVVAAVMVPLYYWLNRKQTHA